MNKNSFILYTEQKEIFKKLSREQAGDLINAIFDYVADGEVPPLSELLSFVFIPIKQNLDRNKEKYESISATRAKAGYKGGKQTQAKQAFASKIKAKPIKSSDNGNGNVPDNGNVKEILNTNLSHPVDKTRVKKQTDYPAWFDDMWTNRAERSGTDSKADCYKACNARLKEGYAVEELVDGMERYRWHCEAVGNIKTAYVMQKSRFFGTSLHFKEDWKINEEQIYADDKSKQFKQQLRAAKEEFRRENGLC